MNSCNKIHKTSQHGPVAMFILKLRSFKHGRYGLPRKPMLYFEYILNLSFSTATHPNRLVII